MIFCYKKNLEISFQNGPEHETTSLNLRIVKKKSELNKNIKQFQVGKKCFLFFSNYIEYRGFITF